MFWAVDRTAQGLQDSNHWHWGTSAWSTKEVVNTLQNNVLHEDTMIYFLYNHCEIMSHLQRKTSLSFC